MGANQNGIKKNRVTVWLCIDSKCWQGMSCLLPPLKIGAHSMQNLHHCANAPHSLWLDKMLWTQRKCSFIGTANPHEKSEAAIDRVWEVQRPTRNKRGSTGVLHTARSPCRQNKNHGINHNNLFNGGNSCHEWQRCCWCTLQCSDRNHQWPTARRVSQKQGTSGNVRVC